MNVFDNDVLTFIDALDVLGLLVNELELNFGGRLGDFIISCFDLVTDSN